MNITKEEIFDKIRSNDSKYFTTLYYGDCPKEWRSEFTTVYDQHYGDGAEYFVTLYFKLHDIYVSLVGTYSSWDSPEWDSVSLAEPFEFKETRYKAVTLEYIRDKKIETVLKKEGE